jgi:hypothetical protein
VFAHRMLALYFAANQQWDSAAVELRQVTRLSTDLADQSPAAAIPSAIALTRGQLGEAERKDGRLHGDQRATRIAHPLSQGRREPGPDPGGVSPQPRRRGKGPGPGTRSASARGNVPARSTLTPSWPRLTPWPINRPGPARYSRSTRPWSRSVCAGAMRLILRIHMPAGDRAKGFLALAEGRGSDAAAAFRAWWDASGCANCAQA